MKTLIILPGKAALRFAGDGISEYLKRLGRFGNYELKNVRDHGGKEAVSGRLLEASEGSYRVVLDERGKLLDTLSLSQKLLQLKEAPEVRKVSFLIGASDGHTTALRENADLLLALSPLTLQHELATLILTEQLYRVATIQAGMPYHRP